MSSVVLNGDTSGSGTITVPAVAGSFTATIGSATGTHYPFTASTAVTPGSVTSVDFTPIPSWVKRITVMFKGLSFSASAQLAIQIGSGSVTTSGYAGSAAVFTGAGVANASYTAGFAAEGSSASLTSATLRHGLMILTLEDASTNTWVASGNSLHSGTTTMGVGGGSIALSGVLDRVRITTIAGTATVTAGSINILYE